MSSATAQRGPIWRAIRSFAFRTFYGLPPRLRRTVVRLGVGTYTVGAVVLATQAIVEPVEPVEPGEPCEPGEPANGPSGLTAGRLLMVRQPPGKGWSLPAGLLGRGERPVDAAARELAEETGVLLDAAALTPAVPNAVVHTSGRWIDMVFTATIPADTPLTVNGYEILEAAWQPIRSLPPVTPSTGRLLAHYGLGPYAEYPEVTQ